MGKLCTILFCCKGYQIVIFHDFDQMQTALNMHTGRFQTNSRKILMSILLHLSLGDSDGPEWIGGSLIITEPAHEDMVLIT